MHHPLSQALTEARTRIVVLAVAATAAVVPGTAAWAHPARDAGSAHRSASGQHRDPAATPSSITYTNPLQRSRGVGAGGGRL